jgi:hypothetical protein
MSEGLLYYLFQSKVPHIFIKVETSGKTYSNMLWLLYSHITRLFLSYIQRDFFILLHSIRTKQRRAGTAFCSVRTFRSLGIMLRFNALLQALYLYSRILARAHLKTFGGFNSWSLMCLRNYWEVRPPMLLGPWREQTIHSGAATSSPQRSLGGLCCKDIYASSSSLLSDSEKRILDPFNFCFYRRGTYPNIHTLSWVQGRIAILQKWNLPREHTRVFLLRLEAPIRVCSHLA